MTLVILGGMVAFLVALSVWAGKRYREYQEMQSEDRAHSHHDPGFLERLFDSVRGGGGPTGL
jgi:hypothetical protein